MNLQLTDGSTACDLALWAPI